MFNYKCSECGNGIVKETILHNYHIKIKGYPFVIDDAKVGICDKCGAEHFAAVETKRWDRVFEQSLIENRLFLSPKDITNLRKQLGLSMEQFALLVGCTRQSLYNWENQDRVRPQSRTIDLMLKLVDRSRNEEKVDVIEFLIEEARKLGIVVRTDVRGKGNSANFSEMLILQVEQIAEQSWKESELEESPQYAAQKERGRIITIVKTMDGKRLGKLIYDFLADNLVLELETYDLNWSNYHVELVTTKEEIIRGEPEQIDDKKITLLKKSGRTDKEIKELRLIPVGV